MWRGAPDHIEAAAQEAGVGKRDATSRAWNAFKNHQPSPESTPSLIRAAIVGGRMESTMSTASKPSASVYKRQFAGKATAADKKAIAAYRAGKSLALPGKAKASASKAKASGSKTMNFPANICTPAGRVRKPTSAVYKRYFAKTATAAEKRHVIAYNAWKRAGSPAATTKAGLSKKTATSKKKASSAKKAASTAGKPSASTYRAQFAGKATAAQKKAIQAYAAKKRAAKAGKPAASVKKAASKKKATSRKAASKPAPVRKAASAASAAATVVKAHQSGKPLASGKTMTRKAFQAKYGSEVKAAIGQAKGVNYLSACKVAHEAFDRAPQGQKATAIKVAISAAKKAGIFRASTNNVPAKRKASPAKRKASPAKRKTSSSKRSAGTQRFKVAGSVTVSAA